MQHWLTPNILYLDREDWQEHTELPLLGSIVPLQEREYAIMHHTVVIDPDPTPNIRETLAEVKAQMRRLQTIRPDLGLDVPYSYVVFLMAGGWIVICEGRGRYRRGAHTKYYNRRGIGMAIQGNLELAVDLDPYVDLLGDAWSWLKYEQGLINLGNEVPGPAAQIFGHQDFRDPDDRETWTACPGRRLMAIIGRIRFKRPEEEEHMASFVKEDGRPYVWLVVGNTKVYVPYFQYVWNLQQHGLITGELFLGTKDRPVVHTVAQGTLRSLGRIES